MRFGSTLLLLTYCLWCTVPYIVHASVWSWWLALRTDAHWKVSAHSGMFIWLTFEHVLCTGHIPNALKKLHEWVPHTKQGEKCPQTRRFQGRAQQRIGPRSPDFSPLGFDLWGRKIVSVFSCNWKWRDRPFTNAFLTPVKPYTTVGLLVIGWNSPWSDVCACGDRGGEHSERLLWILT